MGVVPRVEIGDQNSVEQCWSSIERGKNKGRVPKQKSLSGHVVRFQNDFIKLFMHTAHVPLQLDR